MTAINVRYFLLTAQQKLALSNEDFLRAVKLEAIERGVRPPIELGDAIKQSEFRGFQKPADAVPYYQIFAPDSYNVGASGVAYPTEAAAWAALEGAVPIYEDGYGDTRKQKLGDPQKFEVRCVQVTNFKAKTFAVRLEEFLQDDEKFDAIVEECRKDWSDALQQDYNHKVQLRKRAEYLELAGNDIEVAKRFWAKVEGGEFPAEAA